MTHHFPSPFPNHALIAANGDLTCENQGFDEFETALVPVLRHFMTAFTRPDSQAWQFAYSIAAERLGENIGLSAAQAMLKLLRALFQRHPEGVSFRDPLDKAKRDTLTRDEATIIAMLHHMRRDNTAPARQALYDLTDGRMDPGVIRAGLSFARRFHSGPGPAPTYDTRPRLRLVR